MVERDGCGHKKFYDIHFYQWRMIASRDYIIYADQTRISFSYNFLRIYLIFLHCSYTIKKNVLICVIKSII